MTFDLQFFAQERTEPATPRKRRKEREEGRVAKSQDMGAAVVIITGLFALLVFGNFMFSYMRTFLVETIAFMGGATIREDGWFQVLARETIPTAIIPWLPLGMAAAIGALIVTISQVGLELTPKPLIPKMDRFNPVSGMKKILSLRSIVELFKGLLKASLFATVIYFAMQKDMPELVSAIRFPLEIGLSQLFSKLLNLSFRLAFLLLVIAVFDYAYQKWEFERSIKMSKQELKEEYKQMEGDPQIKSKIRQKQRELARSRMMSSVPKADVVITNPTHLAVALEYDREIMEAPVLVAKGSGFIAHKIRELAASHGVPVVENKPLARVIYDTMEIGDEIPEHLYKAIAEVLAFIYRLKGGGQKGTSGRSGAESRQTSVFM